MTTEEPHPEFENVPTIIQLLDADADALESWSQDDLSGMWRHMLTGGLLKEWVGLTQQVDEIDGGGQLTLGGLFEAQTPNLEQLRVAKAHAKLAGSEANNSMPSVIVKAVYYMSIAVAMTRYGQSITSFSDEALSQGLGWMAQQAWLDEASRATLREALELLSAQGVRPEGAE